MTLAHWALLLGAVDVPATRHDGESLMMPTETSGIRAARCPPSRARIRTMIVRVMLAQRYAVFRNETRWTATDGACRNRERDQIASEVIYVECPTGPHGVAAIRRLRASASRRSWIAC